LGWVVKDLGCSAELEVVQQHFERALTIRVMTLGDSDPRVARSYSALGWVLKDRHLFLEAKVAFEEALSIDESVPGLARSVIAEDLRALAFLAATIGDKASAQNFFARADALSADAPVPESPL
jgi:hypothetical protein